MNQEITFSYNYSPRENKEIQEIRKRYLPRNETKLDELKRLDRCVQESGIAEALCAGIGGLLVFGLGLCLAMQVIGNGVFLMIIGFLLGIVGILGMAAAYPIHQRIADKAKEEYAPRILQLADELDEH